MPYIKQDVRDTLNDDITRLSTKIHNIGDLNYCISMLIKRFLGKNYHYNNLNACIGVLECAKLELYRRVVSPYEDKKIRKNGDLRLDCKETILKKIKDKWRNICLIWR